MTVNIGNGAALAWGTSVGSQIVGTLKFGSATAANTVTFSNNVNLGGANRTVNVDDNPGSSTDYAVMSGVISNSTGTAGLTKSGLGTLRLNGASGNTYNGVTTITGWHSGIGEDIRLRGPGRFDLQRSLRLHGQSAGSKSASRHRQSDLERARPHLRR